MSSFRCSCLHGVLVWSLASGASDVYSDRHQGCWPFPKSYPERSEWVTLDELVAQYQQCNLERLKYQSGKQAIDTSLTVVNFFVLHELPLGRVSRPHSLRSTDIASVLAARRAGMKDASSAASRSRERLPITARGSSELV
jgi:hypothetical protein